MTILEIVDLIVVILCVVTYAVMMYFKVKGNVLEAVSELIAMAETTGLSGNEKMKQVVGQLMEKIPAPLRKFLSEEVVRKLAQYIFDWMRKYADNYLESKKEPDSEKAMEELKQMTIDTTAALVTELLDMSAEALLQKAGEVGVQVNADTSKEECVKQILLTVLNN